MRNQRSSYGDYEGGLSKRIGSLGTEIVVKNTIWTEALAAAGDYLLIGESTETDPVELALTRCGRLSAMPTLDRLADDFAIITGV
jgi:hypothetical protein